MEQTESISIKHKRIAGLLLRSFIQNYNSAEKKIKSDEIISKLRERGYRIGDAELREVIGLIRRKDLASPGFILSSNEGYWYSENEAEMERVWRSQHSRAIEIMTNFAPLHRRFKHLMTEKNSLFT